METRNSSTSEKSEKNHKGLWGYSESFFVASEILLLGFVLEIFLKGMEINPPRFPGNLIIILLLAGTTVLAHFLFRKTRFIRWFSSVPCAVSAISAYALLVLLLGFIPQQENGNNWLQLSGLSHLKSSWPFVLIQIFLIFSLGFVILRRAFPLNFKNLGFFLNHAGLWIIITVAGLGSGDLRRVTIDLGEHGSFMNKGITADQQVVTLPFSMQLLQFRLDYYNPSVAIVDRSRGEIVQKNGDSFPLVGKGTESNLLNWTIDVKDYLPYAIKQDTGYIYADKPGSIAVARVVAHNNRTGVTASGWITNGSLLYEPRFLALDPKLILILTDPSPKKFESRIAIHDSRRGEDTVDLVVNKPISIRGWKLYQYSYDTQLGRYSKTSVVEAVRDPWLPLVYVGVLMLMAGAVYLFWLGRPVKEV